MTRLFPRLTPLLLLVVMMATTASAFAAPAHEACVTKQHECEDVPTIAECCCHLADTGGQHSTPPEQRIDVRSSAALATVALPATVLAGTDRLVAEHPISVSPRLCLLDLTTLFATLLI